MTEMTEARAREILAHMTQPNGSLYDEECLPVWKPGELGALLVGRYTPDECEAFAFWMRKYGAESNLPGPFERDCAGAPCPYCNGYADRCDATESEVAQHQTCDRTYACCIAAFVCRLCGLRFVGDLEAPGMD